VSIPCRVGGRVPQTSALLVCLALSAAAQTSQPDSRPAAPPASKEAVVRALGIKSLTLGAELRWRFEGRFNYDFRDNAGTDEDFVEQRARLSADAELTDQLRAFVQVQDVRSFGEETSTTDDSADGIDMHQAFLDARLECLGGKARVGRQEVAFGDERLIGSVNWLGQGRVFDGARLDLPFGPDDKDNVAVFAFQTREIFGARNDDQFFTGVYAQWRRAELDVDLYGLYLHKDHALGTATLTAVPEEDRFTVGNRTVWRGNPVDAGYEVATQFGRREPDRIPIGETLAAQAHVGLLLGDGDSKPRLAFETEYASGNHAPAGQNQRFDPLFPTAHMHLGTMDFAFWSNVWRIGPEFSIVPCKDTRLVVEWFNLHSVVETDTFGGPNNTLSTGVVNGHRYMGDEIDVQVWTKLLERIQTSAGYGIFLPGHGVRDARGSDDVAHFVFVMAGIRF